MPRPCTLHAAAHLQPIHALRQPGPQRPARLTSSSSAVGSMNIHDERDRRHQTSDSIIA